MELIVHLSIFAIGTLLGVYLGFNLGMNTAESVYRKELRRVIDRLTPDMKLHVYSTMAGIKKEDLT